MGNPEAKRRFRALYHLFLGDFPASPAASTQFLQGPSPMETDQVLRGHVLTRARKGLMIGAHISPPKMAEEL